ncbi:unnamed protein product, partial [Ectocarpus sp. 12 AP-2014]
AAGPTRRDGDLVAQPLDAIPFTATAAGLEAAPAAPGGGGVGGDFSAASSAAASSRTAAWGNLEELAGDPGEDDETPTTLSLPSSRKDVIDSSLAPSRSLAPCPLSSTSPPLVALLAEE